MPPTDESQTSDIPGRHIQNRWDMLYRFARDFGIMSVFAGLLLGWVYVQTSNLQKEAKEDKTFIRTELLPMVKDGTKANYEVAESLEDFNTTSAKLADALDDLTKQQKENAENE